MKQFIKHTPYLMSLLMLLGITSCTKMDEYLKYTDGKEILYTGIPDSIAMYSGYNRVVFRGVLASDPSQDKDILELETGLSGTGYPERRK